MKPSFMPWLLASAVAMAVALPVRPAHAATPLAFRSIDAYGDMNYSYVQDGSTIDRGLRELRLNFSEQVFVTDPGLVTVTDGQGRPAPWRMSSGGNIMLQPVELLHNDDTYRITVKGGPNGVHSPDGAALPADVTMTLHTEERPWQMSDMNVFGDPLISQVRDGGLLPRTATELRMNFTRRIGRVDGAVTIKDSQGRDPGWTVTNGSGNTVFFYIRSPQALPKNETYTIQVKGGADGLLSEMGVPLPEDLTVTLHTDDRPAPVRATLSTRWQQQKVLQSEIYRVKAAAGPLTVQLTGLTAETWGKLLLEDVTTHEGLLNKNVTPDSYSEMTVQLPHAGEYNLLVAPNRLDTVQVTGMDLEVSPEIPALKLPATMPYETRNEAFTVTPKLFTDPQATESVKVTLNKETLTANALRADGTVEPVTIDPEKLADGLYLLNMVATARNSGNMAVNAQTFLVDRVAAFTDVGTTHWARRYVEVMHHLGVINGRTATEFAPGQPVKRSEFAKMLALTLHLAPSGSSSVVFADLPDGWAKPHIQALAERGLIKGEVVGSQTFFYPDRTITRAEAATIIGRVLGIAGEDVSGAPSKLADFSRVPDWAKPSVLILSEMGWVSGFPDGNFYPGNTLNRDQAAKILANFIGMQ
ncbi:MAG TPA: S-layer homology domain-containing protein [Symbiobacteriaceae bacterium]|nr:S-layer homology domain-containing protein [Symbiobacteriaceae bacterium]